MCPYARFQSAMFDRDTLDHLLRHAQRGEPRGSRKRGTDHRAAGLGDCINCTMCVQVCPTGIDIRDGLQHQCIACAACIDVCDQVMERMGYPKGLVRYTTQNAVDGPPDPHRAPAHPRLRRRPRRPARGVRGVARVCGSRPSSTSSGIATRSTGRRVTASSATSTR